MILLNGLSFKEKKKQTSKNQPQVNKNRRKKEQDSIVDFTES